jgi:anti-sigma B factor antagonist
LIEFHVDGSAVLTLSGEIDVANAARIHEQVHDVLAASPSAVVLTMRDVRFIDSTGIGALIAARNECLAVGVPLRLADPSGPVVRMLQLTGLDQVFDVVAQG